MFKKDNLEITSDKVDTIIGKDTHFEGTINGKGLIRIDGEAQGSVVNKGDVIIGESGTVSADLKARNVTIAGCYEGALEAEGKLELKKTATAAGTFKTNGLVIEEGAVLSGDIEMHKRPDEKDTGRQESNYKPPAAEKPEKNRQPGALNKDSVAGRTTTAL